MASEAPEVIVTELQPPQMVEVDAVPPLDSLAAFKEGIDALPDSLTINKGHIIFGDFNADAKEDLSALVTNQNNSKVGVIIIHASDKPDYLVFGGGLLVNGMDDLGWIDVFRSIPKGQTVAATLVDPQTGDIIGEDEENAETLEGNGIYMHVNEAGGGGILYWDGSKYNWLHIE
ncbi:hypothetical protein D770_05140 [Flammeovirgaceae bacterium 311]|nr:hypothetical protein D770_05140 [Flammeovirgaceae bacterium 311]